MDKLLDEAQRGLTAFAELARELKKSRPASPQNVEVEVAKSASAMGPLQVQLAVIVARVFNVDTVAQTFGVQLNIRMQWDMPSTEEVPMPGEDDGDWEPKYTPKYRIKNLMEAVLEDKMYMHTERDGKNLVVMEAVHLLILAEQLELQSFPNDCQDLSICLESKLPVEEVSWVPMEERLVKLQAGTCLLNDFALVKECPMTFNLFYADKNYGRYSSLSLKVKIARKSHYYMINVAMVMLLICSFVLCSWAIHPANIEGRYAVDFTLILTAVAFKLVLTSMLPPVSYMTLLDKYVMAGFMYLTLITILHTALPFRYYMHIECSPLTLPSGLSGDLEQDLIDADVFVFYVSGGVWLLFNVAYGVYFAVTRSKEYKDFVANAKKEQAAYDTRNDEVVDSRTMEVSLYHG